MQKYLYHLIRLFQFSITLVEISFTSFQISLQIAKFKRNLRPLIAVSTNLECRAKELWKGLLRKPLRHFEAF